MQAHNPRSVREGNRRAAGPQPFRTGERVGIAGRERLGFVTAIKLFGASWVVKVDGEWFAAESVEGML